MTTKEYTDRLKEISELPPNWDGYGAVSISKEVLERTKEFIELLPEPVLELIDFDDITPAPHGTITVYLYKGKDFISPEIGKTKYGIYGKKDGKSFWTDNISDVNIALKEMIEFFVEIQEKTPEYQEFLVNLVNEAKKEGGRKYHKSVDELFNEIDK